MIPNSVHDTGAPWYRSGSPLPSEIVRLRVVNAARSETVVADSLRSRILVRDAAALDAEPLVGRVEDDEALGVGERMRVQDDPVHDAEDRGVDADSERQAGDRDSQKARIPGERPDRVARILQKHGGLDGIPGGLVRRRASILARDTSINAAPRNLVSGTC